MQVQHFSVKKNRKDLSAYENAEAHQKAKRKLGVVFIVALASILILFPFIDTNFFYANRIKNRINILQEITELDMDKINQDENLLKEYNSIIKEINESDNNYINKVLNNNKNEHFVGKFISGGLLYMS